MEVKLELCYVCGAELEYHPGTHQWWCPRCCNWRGPVLAMEGDATEFRNRWIEVCNTLHEREEQLRQSEARIVQLEQVLGFYADEGNWEPRQAYAYGGEDEGEMLIDDGCIATEDGGQRARQVLANK